MQDFLKKVFTKKEKVKEDPGVIGHYNSRQFHSFKYALIYANEILLTDNPDEKTADIMIFTRTFKGVTFINVLVFKEDYVESLNQYKYEALKPLLKEKGCEIADKSVVLVLFQHKNDKTIKLAKNFCNSTKEHFEQGLVYNANKVQMDYYKPVPTFYKLYDKMCEDLFFDLGFIDDLRD